MKKTVLERIETIVANMPTGGSTKTLEQRRYDYFVREFKKARIFVKCIGTASGGKAGKIKEMKDKYRVFYRCGYGSYNYAPFFDVAKEPKRITFYLISKAYAHQDWQYFGMSNVKKELDDMAMELWGKKSDIESQTYLKNYRVVGAGVAEKKFNVSFSMI